MDTGCPTLTDGLCDKLDSNNDDARVRITITSTPTEDVDTYIYQVKSVKTDGGATEDTCGYENRAERSVPD